MTIDFGEFYLKSSLKEGHNSIDVIAKHEKFNLSLQRQGGILQRGVITLVNKNNTEEFEKILFEGATENGTVNGKQRYTLTIALADDNSTKMRGLPNDYDGTNNVSNVNEDRIIADFPANSTANINVGTHDIEGATKGFNEAKERFAKSQKMASLTETKKRLAFEKRQKDDQKSFKATESQARINYEAEIDQKINSFISEGTEVDGIASKELANNADLHADYQNKGAMKLTFDSGNILFAVLIQNYAKDGVDGLAKLLDSDGKTVLRTITKNKTTAKVVIS